MRWPTALLCFLLAGYWGLAGYAWPKLPERIPQHFDLAGHPDRWSERGLGSWFLLPLLATALGLLFGWLLPRWISHLAEHSPHWINVPDRERFLALDAPARRRALEPLLALLCVLACEITLLFAWIQYGSLRVATGDWARLPSWIVLVAIAALVATALAVLPIARRALDREHAAAGAKR